MLQYTETEKHQPSCRPASNTDDLGMIPAQPHKHNAHKPLTSAICWGEGGEMVSINTRGVWLQNECLDYESQVLGIRGARIFLMGGFVEFKACD